MSEIRGVGVDMCAVSRMAELLEDQRFLQRCFCPEEVTYIRSRGRMAAASMAGIWAAKEAVSKALGTGIAFPMTDICVTHSDHGAPRVSLTGQALHLAEGGSVHISISHEGDMAICFCIWQ